MLLPRSFAFSPGLGRGARLEVVRRSHGIQVCTGSPWAIGPCADGSWPMGAVTCQSVVPETAPLGNSAPVSFLFAIKDSFDLCQIQNQDKVR